MKYSLCIAALISVALAVSHEEHQGMFSRPPFLSRSARSIFSLGCRLLFVSRSLRSLANPLQPLSAAKPTSKTRSTPTHRPCRTRTATSFPSTRPTSIWPARPRASKRQQSLFFQLCRHLNSNTTFINNFFFLQLLHIYRDTFFLTVERQESHKLSSFWEYRVTRENLGVYLLSEGRRDGKRARGNQQHNRPNLSPQCEREVVVRWTVLISSRSFPVFLFFSR